MLGMAAATASAWDSRLLSLDPASGQWQRNTIEFDGAHWTLPDVSYAGYRLSEQAPATGVPCKRFAVDDDGDGDITAALQAAVNAAGAAGGGVVVLPAGQFTVSRSIEIPFDNISVEGRGSARTHVCVPATYDQSNGDYDEGVFTFGRRLKEWRQGWWNNTAVLANVVKAIAEQSSLVELDRAGRLATGDWIAIVQYFWPELAKQSSGQGKRRWPAIAGWPEAGGFDRRYAFVYLRQVVAVSGTSITVDVPLPMRLDPAHNPIRLRRPDGLRDTPLVRNSGISGLTMTFEDNSNGKDGRPGGSAVLFDSLVDGWAHDVHVHNFPRFGIRATHAARITISESAVLDMQDDGSGGFGYAFTAFSSQNVLFVNNHAEEVRRGFMALQAPSSMVVFSGNRSYATRMMGDGTQHSLSQQVVFDRHETGYGTGLRMIARGPKSDRAYETAHGGVVWNLRGDGVRGGFYGGALLMNPVAGSRAFVIGVDGMPVFDLGQPRSGGNPGRVMRVRPDLGVQFVEAEDSQASGAANRNVLYEGVGRAGLQPASLFAAQLLSRSGQGLRRFGGACGDERVRKQAIPRRYTGEGTLIFDSDHLGYTAVVSSKCLACRVDGRPNQASADSDESLVLNLAPENWSPGMHLRGAWIDIDQVQAIRLRVMATRPNQAVRMSIGSLQLEDWAPEREPVTTHIEIDGLVPGQWTSQVVSVGELRGGGFDTVSFSSLGPRSSGAIYIDDVVALPRD